ncbi:unnamed protein product, partial [marine sediment metagenome]
GVDEVSYGIEVEALNADPLTASQVTIRGNEIYNCDNTFSLQPSWESAAILINGWLEHYDPLEADCTVIMENNDIHDNYIGIYAIKTPSSYAHFNNIYDNRVYGVISAAASDDSTAVFDAENNWWGDVAGPDTSTKTTLHNPYENWIADTNGVSENVDYLPWLIRTDLQEGWNIYSMPITPDEGCLEPFEAALFSAGIEAAYYFDSLNQIWGFPDDGGPLDAIYLKMVSPVTVNIWASSDATFPSQKEMKVGWNFVGLAE